MQICKNSHSSSKRASPRRALWEFEVRLLDEHHEEPARGIANTRDTYPKAIAAVEATPPSVLAMISSSRQFLGLDQRSQRE